ncbi:MAG: hypothetical protein HN689_06680 [Euryarchaeota archaeon]|nr:hypothetical protein [Euryarchaeota archaeon]
MKKILAVLFACSIVMAGCMDLTDEDIDAIVDAIVEIPGCNADETAYNYDVNATNNNACLTEMMLKESISEFITTVGSQPAADKTIGIMQEGSDGAGGDWESVEVTSPSGLYKSMDVDMGVFAWSQSELITAAADGTTLIQVDWDGNEMLMNSAVEYNSLATSLNGSNMDDDGMDIGMGMDGMEMPSAEIPEDFDPSQALYEAGLSTDNGYSFSTTMEDEMDNSMTMTFTLGMDFLVDSVTMIETTDGQTSISTITMMDEQTSLNYLNINPNLPYEALPFTLSPMDGMDDGDGDDGQGNSEINAALTDNWASSLNDYSTPEFSIYTGFENVNTVHFDLYDMDGNSITSMTIQPTEFTDMGDGYMIYYVDINHLLTDVGCYTLIAAVITNDDVEIQWVREDICNYGDDNDPGEDEVFVCDNGNEIPADYVNDGDNDCGDGSDEYDYEEQFVFECLYITVNDNLVYDSEGIFDKESSWDETGLDDSMCYTEVENPDDYQVVDNGINNLPSNFSAWDDDEEGDPEKMSIGDDNYIYLIEAENPDDCDGIYDQSTDECTNPTGVMISETNEQIMTWTMTYESSFNCLDGEQIMHEYANDGNDDCDDGTDEPSYQDGYETSYYECYDGSYILISQVNDGIEDCQTSGEDETGIIEINITVLYQFNPDTGSGLIVAIQSDDHDDEDEGPDDHGHDDEPMFTCTNGDEIPVFLVNNGETECDGSDEQQYDSEGNEINSFTCMDGSQVWIYQVNDGIQDCPDGDDESMDDDYDLVTPSELLSITDTDESGTMSLDEFNATFGEEMDVNDPTFAEIFADNDYDNSGDLDIEELEGFIYELDDYVENGDDDENLLFEADTDGSEGMSFAEFEVVFSDGAGDEISQDMISDLQEIFNNSDLDDSGELELDEMEQFVTDVDDYMMSLEDGEEMNGAEARDGHDDNGNDGIDDSGAPTADELINMTDTDDSGTMSFDEFIAFMNSPDPDGGGEDDESLPQSMVDEINAIFDNNDADQSGDLDLDELDQFILDIDEYFISIESGDGEMFTCDNGDEVPADYVDDGDNDCGDWSDEPNHNDNGDDGMDDGHDDNGNDGHNDHGEHGSMFDWMISNSHDMPMEGSFSDYSIVLAMCTMDGSDSSDDMMGMGESSTMDCEDDLLKVSVTDAMTLDAVVMFHDADMSGTISDGDMVHISPDVDVDGDWNMVRLYSTSADAYSDENPMQTPGFSSMIGIVALLGAALLTRRD